MTRTVPRRRTYYVRRKNHIIGSERKHRRLQDCLSGQRVKETARTVHVLMTQNATNFINPITFESLTGNKCLVDTFDRNFEFQVEHVALASRADLVVVAPASANVIGKLAHGIADDMLTTTVMACKCPKILRRR